MSVQNNILPINLAHCFSCENQNSHTSNCSCGFNVDTVCEKLIELCKNRVIRSITSLEFIIGSFTLKHVKKISSKFGYVSNITLTEASKACAIEFAMRSDRFLSGRYNVYQQAMTGANDYINHMRKDNQEARSFMWKSIVKNSQVLMPPLIGALTQKIYRSKLMYARHIQTELESGRYRFREFPAHMRLLPDDVTIVSIRIVPPPPPPPRIISDIDELREQFERLELDERGGEQQRLAIQVLNESLELREQIERLHTSGPQPRRLGGSDERERLARQQHIQSLNELNHANALSLVTQQSDREKQIANNNVKTWKSIFIKSNVLQKTENQESETCPVCQDDIIHSKKTKTSCGHTLCSDCISDTITKCGANCIMCRTVITSIEFGSIEEIVKCQDIKIQIISS